MEGNPTPKEAYEAKKRERDANKGIGGPVARKGARRALRLIILLIVLAALIYWIWGVVKENSPVGADLSQAYPIVGQDHILVGSPRPEYNSNPPTSGNHYDTPAAVGYYERQLPDEQVVHNLEHGDIWISYRPDASTSTREALRQFMGNPKVIVTMRSEDSEDVAVAAWGRLDTFDLVGADISPAEIQRIKDFVLRYQNKGPEKTIDSASMLQ